MKKLATLLIAALTAVLLITCTKKDKNKDEEYERICGEYHGKTLYTGPKEAVITNNQTAKKPT